MTSDERVEAIREQFGDGEYVFDEDYPQIVVEMLGIIDAANARAERAELEVERVQLAIRERARWHRENPYAWGWRVIATELENVADALTAAADEEE